MQGGKTRRRRGKSDLTIPERASAASLQGRLRRKGKKDRGAKEEPQHYHNTKPEQYGVRNAEWELHHHCQQAREQQHGQKAEGGEVTCRQGMGTSSSLIWSGVPDKQDTWGLQEMH
jgi:hypothetical protein